MRIRIEQEGKNKQEGKEEKDDKTIIRRVIEVKE